MAKPPSPVVATRMLSAAASHFDPAVPIEETDETWRELLATPEAAPFSKEHKAGSPVVVGVIFRPGARGKDLVDVESVTAAVLDLDEGRWTLERLTSALEGVRFIAWTTYKSTAEDPRWRIVVPLKNPMPPEKYPALWEALNGVFEGQLDPQTRNANRLGYFGRVPNTGLAAYRWHIQAGALLDWRELGLVDSVAYQPAPVRGAVYGDSGVHPLPPGASERDVALAAALQRYSMAGTYWTTAEEGERHKRFLALGCRLWWDWAAEDAEFVLTVFRAVNAKLAAPKPDDQLAYEVQRCRERVSKVKQAGPYGEMRLPAMRLTKQRVEELAYKLSQRGSRKADVLAQAMHEVAVGGSGRQSDPKDGRMITDVVNEITKAFPEESTDAVMAALAGWVEVLRKLAQGVAGAAIPTDAELRAQIDKHFEHHRRKFIVEIEASASARAQRIADAIDGRTEPYTREEIAAWTARGFHSRAWIIQCGNDFYCMLNGRYVGPYKQNLVESLGSVYFAASDEVSAVYDAREGKSVPMYELMSKFGWGVSSVSYDLGQDSEFLLTKDKLTIRPKYEYPEPEFSPWVDYWLRNLVQDKYPLLCQWFGSVLELSQPTAALIMATPPGTGKTLLAVGLAKLWHANTDKQEPFTKLDGMQASHLLTSPFVMCDENVPRGWKEQGQFLSKLRQFVTEGSRVGGREGQLIVQGYPRIMFASNNIAEFFRAPSRQNRDEHEAVMQRVLFIDTGSDETRENVFTGSNPIPPHEREAMFSGETIARHIMFLRNEQRAAGANAQRFVRNNVIDAKSTLRGAMASSTEEVGLVFEWIRACMADKVHRVRAVFVDSAGDIFVAGLKMTKAWTEIMPSAKTVNSPLLRQALLSVSHPKAYQTWYGGKLHETVRKVNLEALMRWARETGADDIEEAIDEYGKVCASQYEGLSIYERTGG